ncbi:alpha-1,3-mannosyl-glycoprotein 4-beta-N-acetylglucosaminyltransferase B-like [Teleopsis dalmanni]|uniref:alpha-1,3-mannosyl-glycoprotein 4-beta-N-acetylglucosaminyltransferase B-like n=1 Tax=Teleopsis dalmanni TaxID=139649 RepID=UPI0018CE6F63|nr:alpha-1,3-mannosyl-glycoprotein 4-beta-N-acetylglucosaminyltransferase B-like [Teleopsis dalmanni]
MLKLRQRSCLLLTTLLVLTPCILIVMMMGPELSTEQSLTQRLAESHMRIQYLESMYRARQEDVAILSQYLSALQNGSVISQMPTTPPLYVPTSTSSLTLASAAAGGPAASLLESLSPEARQALKNASHAHSAQRYSTTTAVRLPTAYHFLPHLLDDSASLRPAYLYSKGRADVSIVLGIPTVKREKQSYLLGTLQNLIENMNEEEQNETLIIVFIGEMDQSTVQFIAKQIVTTFEAYVDSGLIDVIAPASSYYPDFNRLRITLNDSLERVKWRSKQNLDFAYLMAYAQSKGTFYVQLEDDILAKHNFITAMKKFAITKSALTKPDHPPWFILDFCQLGFIGKMFKSAELPYLITFFQMFYNDKPVDWLLGSFIESKVCRTDKDQKHCNQERAKYWLHYRPSLFQHIGTSSSLKGKVQKLKDKQFGWKVPTFFAHPHNPPATVKSNIAPYKNYLLKRAYRGETYFWGLLPQPGDIVQFIFEKPTQIRRYYFRSGNSEHPSDRFYNTTIEVLPADTLSENASVWSTYNSTNDGYLIVGAFDAIGVAEGALDTKIGAIKEIRLHVHGDSENWVLLSEIDLQTAGVANAEAENKNKIATVGS